ncbi:hypothetical protein [Candidatus Nanohalobium constans]|uniref:Uncharacterized protein n=1 Tax=Candidatus Nanohalobium constans TaxID=2565781 RepID=A0A5Q0UFA4_9ARCH|nr:hypothetical protein [Candidatus Nanohalobium constans]QGA80184.1 hypothetical protein LC1Nh_0281 [Candidatus Nanohalobium constans]
MELNEEHRKILKEAVLSILAVMASAVTVFYLTSDTQTGRIIRFSVPLVVGVVLGGRIYFRELNKLEEKLE